MPGLIGFVTPMVMQMLERRLLKWRYAGQR
jgi:ABC-type nitrate/sulfonate/bicarbonate transport system permease component